MGAARLQLPWKTHGLGDLEGQKCWLGVKNFSVSMIGRRFIEENVLILNTEWQEGVRGSIKKAGAKGR